MRATVALLVVALLLLAGLGAWWWSRPIAPAEPVPEAAPAKKRVRKEKVQAAPEGRCLPPPTDVGEDGMVASAGIPADEVRRVMRGAVPATLTCFEGSPSVTLHLAVTVACTGKVARVEVIDDGGASSEIQACVREALGRARFPSHALPDGDRFEYPLVYTAP